MSLYILSCCVKSLVERVLSSIKAFILSNSDIDKMKALMEDSTLSTNDLTQQLKIYNDMDRDTYHNKDLEIRHSSTSMPTF
jgi:LEA14-like dessication related protein